MTMPADDHVSRADTVRARRLEVFTGSGRRRDWTVEQKASIVAESFRSGNVSEVVRRHGLTPTQLFAWRRASRPHGVAALDAAPEFVRAVIESSTGKEAEPRENNGDPLIGFELEGTRLDLSGSWRGDGDDDHSCVEGLEMIGPSGAVRVMIATRPVDFRKGAEGLAALVREAMQADPFDGAIYVFRAKRADRIKLVDWETKRAAVRIAKWRAARPV
jgi:transposase-like protein